MKKILSAILVTAVFAALSSCGKSARSLSPEEKFKNQAIENAQAYLMDKYGFKASVKSCKPITEDTFDFPVNYKPDEDASVYMEQDEIQFYVIISGKNETTEGKDTYQYTVINDDLHDYIEKDIGLPVTCITAQFNTIDSVPTDVYFRSKSEYYTGSNLSDMTGIYDYCCIEVYDRDLSQEAVFNNVKGLFTGVNKYFELCIVSYRNEESYNAHPVYSAYLNERQEKSYDKLSDDVFNSNSDKISSYRRYFGDGTSEYVSFESPAETSITTQTPDNSVPIETVN